MICYVFVTIGSEYREVIAGGCALGGKIGNFHDLLYFFPIGSEYRELIAGRRLCIGCPDEQAHRRPQGNEIRHEGCTTVSI